MSDAQAPAPRKAKAAAASTAPEVEAAVLPPADEQDSPAPVEAEAVALPPTDEDSVPLGAGVSPELIRLILPAT